MTFIIRKHGVEVGKSESKVVSFSTPSEFKIGDIVPTGTYTALNHKSAGDSPEVNVPSFEITNSDKPADIVASKLTLIPDNTAAVIKDGTDRLTSTEDILTVYDRDGKPVAVSEGKTPEVQLKNLANYQGYTIKWSNPHGSSTSALVPDFTTTSGDSGVRTNLYQDTRDFDNPSVWDNGKNWDHWHKTGDKFNGLTVMAMNQDWGGLSQTIQAKKGEVYTYSMYARCQSGTGKSYVFYSLDDEATVDPSGQLFSLNENWQRISGTVNVTAGGSIHPRIERSDGNTNTLLIAGPKLEKGRTATPYSLNPKDN